MTNAGTTTSARLSPVRSLLYRREAGIIAVAVILVLLFQTFNDQFLSLDNILVILELAAEIVIVAVGEVMLMVMAEIDLSVGQVFALAPFVMYFAHQAGIPLAGGIALGLAAGGLVGLVNGLMTVRLALPSFIATLGMLYAVNGLNLIISNGYPVLTPRAGLLNLVMGAGKLSPFLWALAVVVVFVVVLNKTTFGLHTLSIGSNPVGSREVGINVDRVKITNFVLVSLLGALIGIIEAFRITSIDPLAGGTEIMLQGIAAAVIGGTALTGGSGTIVGAGIGSIVIAALSDGLTLLGFNAFFFDMVLGIAILVAMVLNVQIVSLRKRR